MRRNTPTRIIETGRIARGAAGQGVGWLQAISDRVRNLRAQIVGIDERLATPFSNGVPGCVAGEHAFLADTTRVLTIAEFAETPDTVSQNLITNLAVNPIIMSGQTYRIPILFPPPGVFQAHNLVVGIEAGFTMFANYPRSGITPLNDYRQVTSTLQGFVPKPNAGTMFYTWQRQVLGNFCGVMPYLPYFWNIVDEKSGRQYAQDWMPSGALLNTRGNSASADAEAARPEIRADSELFEFDTPWLFERDAQVSFLFRPIMDLYQIDKGSSEYPFEDNSGTGVNDLSGGLRNQRATVRVEFHGNRYYERQDVLKEGAYVTNSEPRRHPYGLDDANNGGVGGTRRMR